MQEKILVTGGAGFVGSHSVRALLKAGSAVVVLDNFSAGRSRLDGLDGDLAVIEGDIRDAEAVRAALSGVGRVLHLAAQVSVPFSVENPLDSASVNVGGFLNVLELSRQAGVQRFVYASSAAVYGLSTALPLKEDAARGAVPISPYAQEKRLNEEYAALYTNLYRLSTMGLRYFNVYGPGQDPKSSYAGVVSHLMNAARRGEDYCLHGDGLQTRDFVYVGDVAEANALAVLGSARGVVNIGSGARCSLVQLCTELDRITGVTLGRQHLPPRQGDIRDSQAAVQAAEALLGFRAIVPVSLGLRRLFDALSSAA